MPRCLSGTPSAGTSEAALSLKNPVSGLPTHPAGRRPHFLSNLAPVRIRLLYLESGLKNRILLFDEPTSALSVRETDKTLDYIVQLKNEGISSVLVTHNIYDAYRVADRFVVLSHGRKVLEVDKADTDVEELTRFVVTH